MMQGSKSSGREIDPLFVKICADLLTRTLLKPCSNKAFAQIDTPLKQTLGLNGATPKHIGEARRGDRAESPIATHWNRGARLHRLRRHLGSLGLRRHLRLIDVRRQRQAIAFEHAINRNGRHQGE
jgi:hypothetical protein